VRHHPGVKQKFFFLLLAVLTGGMVPSSSAQGTAFMYQGRLNDGGSPASGSYDLRFALYDAVTNGNAISYPQTNLAVAVSSGVFTEVLDFGAVFTGTNYWLSIGVRTNGSINAFTSLWPRQPVLPVPYAVFANSASNLLGKLATAQLSGTLSSTQLAGTYSIPVSFTNTGNTFSGAFTGTFTGNGAALTSLNASSLAAGTVADARLSANVPLLNTNQTFTGTNQFTGINSFTNWGNTFVGNFSGNGLVQWVPVSNTATQAVRDNGYLLLNSSLTTVTLPLTANMQIGDIVRISGAGVGGWRAALNASQSAIGNFASYRSFFWVPASVPSSGSWNSLASSTDGSVMWAAGNLNGSGGICVSTDSGKTWSQKNNLSGTWNAVACSADGTKVFVASSNGGIQESTDGGQNWPTTLSGASGVWRSVSCSADASKMIAAMSSGYVYVLSGTALVQTSLGSGSWTATASSSDGSHFAAAKGSTVYVSPNGGSSWSSASPGGTVTALAASSDGLKLVAALLNGRICTSTNFGTNWTTSGSTSQAWNCLAASSDCTRLLAGVSNGVLYASSDFGATWASFNTSSNLVWSALASSSDGGTSAAGVGTSSGLIYYSAATTRVANTATNSISGGQGSAVELQYIGNNQFMPVSSSGILWAN